MASESRLELKESNIMKNNKQKSLMVFIICLTIAIIILLIGFWIKSEDFRLILTFLSGASISIAVNALYFFINSRLIEKEEKINNKEIMDLTMNLKNITDNLKYYFENIKISNEIKEHFKSCEFGRCKIIKGSEFYGYLLRARYNAENRVCLTQFSLLPPPSNENEQRVNKQIKYFEEEIELCKKAKNVNVKRMITIDTIDKYNYFKTLIDNVMKANIRNLIIMYINIDNFYNSKDLPKIIGVQIIDNEVIVMDPKLARIEGNDTDQIFIYSEAIADVFSAYYSKLWDEMDNTKKGCILYNGATGYSATKEIWNEIYYRIEK